MSRTLSTTTEQRNYCLTGIEGTVARGMGLVDAEWYTTDISRQTLKTLMRRKDGPAIRDTLIWFALLSSAGVLGFFTWGTWWAMPTFGIYGVLYCSVADSRWHECGHRTAFKTVWMNDAIYEIASFMEMRESAPWRWSHARHHTDTIIVGRDPEIGVPRPPDLIGILLNFANMKMAVTELKRMCVHARGRLTPAEQTYIPDSEWPTVIRNARIYLTIYVIVIALSVAWHTILPLMYVGLPSFYGAWLMALFALTQHAGLCEDVLDHRLNSRTVYLHPLLRFLYWNMNYHIEHHMFPMVPYHALPQLHKLIQSDMPPAYDGLWEAYREIIPTLLRQIRDPGYCVIRTLPLTAQPPITSRVPFMEEHSSNAE